MEKTDFNNDKKDTKYKETIYIHDQSYPGEKMEIQQKIICMLRDVKSGIKINITIRAFFLHFDARKEFLHQFV